ncbi:MAG: fumarylacetoacetate hydrolase family protein [Desulfobacteraceae bacterium]|nr:MAG: fumarylacetoacetate hydrolase family protein [Desulfobacteraceae bacterium]
MKLKLVRFKNTRSPLVAILSRDRWVPVELVHKTLNNDAQTPLDIISALQAGPVDRQNWQDAADDFSGPVPPMDETPILPFQPLSYRDFMLFEAHAVNAARGYAKRFMPMAYKAAALYERMFKRTFPAFRPHPLWYRQPIYYMGNHLSFVTDGHPAAFPVYSKALDYELELGAVIVRPLKNATPEQAEAAIGGFVVFNDFSARDVQLNEMKSGFGPVKAKHFLNAISSVVVTADEVLPRINHLAGEVRINGKVVVRTSTQGMRYRLGQAIAQASLEEQIFPGEFVASGTLPGGCAMENGQWVNPFDILELTIEGVGSLINPIT